MADPLRRERRKRRRREKELGEAEVPHLRESTAAESEAEPVHDVTSRTDDAGPEWVVVPSPQRLARGGEFYLSRSCNDDATRILDTAERVVLTISYGQSNSETGGLARLGRRERVATHGVIDEHRALMFSSGLLGVQGRALDPAELSDLAPAQEDAPAGESGGSSYLRYTLACDDAAALPAVVYLYRSAGQGGQPLARLAQGSQPFINMMTTVERSRYVSALYGQQIWLPHVLLDHGEADRKRETDAQGYCASLIELRRAIDRGVRSRTRQREPVWLLVTILVAPGMRASGTDSAISLAQVEALQEPGIAPVCSPYWFGGAYGFSEGQAVHWGPLAKALLREFGARAARIVREALAQNPLVRLGEPIHRRVYEPAQGQGPGDWVLRCVPFETSPRTDLASVHRIDERISGEVIFAEGGLSLFGGDRGLAENYGFSWTGEGSIIGVTVENLGPRARWTVSLSVGSAGVLSYATTLQDGEPGNAPRKWGNLFDNCAEPSIAVPGMTLRQGMLPFSIAVA